MANQSENSRDLIRRENPSVDRISDLPLHLLDRIFSLLETRDLRHIRILSRQWSDMDITRITLILHRYLNASTLPHWINLALRHAKEFCLTYSEEVDLTLPFYLLIARCFKKLDLELYDKSLTLPKFDGFCWLTHLRLREVQFPDKDLACNFFSRCHVLEYLTIDTCQFHHGQAKGVEIPLRNLKNLTVTHKKLYKIRTEIEEDEILDIPPNQISMNYYGFVVKDYSREKLSSFINLSMYPFLNEGVEHETIGHILLKFLKVLERTSVLELHITAQRALCDVFNDVERSWISFPMLKKLKFELGNDKRFLKLLSHLLMISPNLVTLNLAIHRVRILEPVYLCIHNFQK